MHIYRIFTLHTVSVLVMLQKETTPALPPETIIWPLHTHSQQVTCSATDNTLQSTHNVI